MSIDRDLVLSMKSNINIFNKEKHLKEFKQCKYCIIDFKEDNLLLLLEIDKCKINKDGNLRVKATYDKMVANVVGSNWYLFKDKPTEFKVLEYGSKEWKKYVDEQNKHGYEIDEA